MHGMDSPDLANNAKSETYPLYRHEESEESTPKQGCTRVPQHPHNGTKDYFSHVLKPGDMDNQKTFTRIDFGDFYPDGGWGWIVLTAATVVYILCYGIHFAFGTLRYDIVKYLRPSFNETVWLGSLGVSVTFILSPVMTTICRRKSPRLYAVIGGLICSLGCLFLAFSTQIEQTFISYCAVLSIGCGITTNTANIMIGRYFRTRREFAEVILISGMGIGTSVMSGLYKELVRTLKWMHGLQCIAGILVLTIIAGAMYRSATLYHPRRKVILHIKSQKKKRKHREADKPPYFDFSALGMRSIQGLMVISGIIGLGIHVPFILLLKTAEGHIENPDDLRQLNIYLGIGFLIGCVTHGCVIIRGSKECQISRRNLCQCSAFACGVFTLLFIRANDLNDHVLFVWFYGIFCGGYYYTLKVYTYELVKVKIMERCWSFISAIQGAAILFGSPIAAYLNHTYESTIAGYIFAGVCMILGGLLFFIMPTLERHPSNKEIIQSQNSICSANSTEAAALLDIDLTDGVLSKQLNNIQFVVSPPTQKQNGREGKIITCYIPQKDNEKAVQYILSKVREDKDCLRLDFDGIQNIEKVTDYLVHGKGLLDCNHHTGDEPSDGAISQKSNKESSNSSKSGESKKLKKSSDSVKVDLFDPPSQEKESTATVSYDSDLYINLCEAQV